MNKKPTNLKILQGSFRKDRSKPGEPKPAILADLRPPAWMDRHAKTFWRKQAPKLVAMGILTEIDTDLLAVAAETYSTWRKATDLFRNMSPDHEHYRTVRVEREHAATELRRMLGEFGMTPASRSRVSGTSQSETKDPFEAFLEEKGS